jgi:hypothetical protein
MVNREQVSEFWPRLVWAESTLLGENRVPTCALACERSSLELHDLRDIFTPLRIENCKVMHHDSKHRELDSAQQSLLKVAVLPGEDRPVDKDAWSRLRPCAAPRFYDL